ncbi:hypothetical protein KCU91_g4236, partial [Aureobasidium melanogenum]
MNQSRKNTDGITPAQKHLQAASDLLLSTSPHMSAFLASQLQQTKSPSSSHTKEDLNNCRACGHALVSGWSCTVSKRRLPETPSKKSKTKSKVAKKPAITQHTYIDYKCNLCHSINTAKSDTQAPARRSKSSLSSVQSKPAAAPAPVQSSATATSKSAAATTTSTPSPAPSTAVSSSSEQARAGADKKRNRKQKLGGLQAMLAKSKAPASAPKAFDFMDFMKTN